MNGGRAGKNGDEAAPTAGSEAESDRPGGAAAEAPRRDADDASREENEFIAPFAVEWSDTDATPPEAGADAGTDADREAVADDTGDTATVIDPSLANDTEPPTNAERFEDSAAITDELQPTASHSPAGSTEPPGDTVAPELDEGNPDLKAEIAPTSEAEETSAAAPESEDDNHADIDPESGHSYEDAAYEAEWVDENESDSEWRSDEEVARKAEPISPTTDEDTFEPAEEAWYETEGARTTAVEAEGPWGAAEAPAPTGTDTPPFASAPSPAEDATPAPRRSIWGGIAVFTAAVIAGGLAGWLPGQIEVLLGRAVEPASRTQLEEVENRLGEIRASLDQLRAHPALTTHRERLDKIAAEVEGAQTQIESLASEVSRIGGDSQDDGGTETRLTTIEKALDELARTGAANDLATKTLVNRQDALDTTVGSQRRQLDEIAFLTGAGHSATGETVEDRFVDLEKKFENRVAALESRPEEGPSQLAAFVLAVGQLRLALKTDTPFDKELKRVRTLAPNDSDVAAAIDSLMESAPRGVDTIARLRRSFEVVALAVVRAEITPSGDTWVDKTIARLFELITVRRIGDSVVGDEADAAVARAEAHLGRGELALAVDEIRRLEGPAAEAAASWIKKARARIGADEALARIETRAIQLLADVG